MVKRAAANFPEKPQDGEAAPHRTSLCRHLTDAVPSVCCKLHCVRQHRVQPPLLLNATICFHPLQRRCRRRPTWGPGARHPRERVRAAAVAGHWAGKADRQLDRLRTYCARSCIWGTCISLPSLPSQSPIHCAPLLGGGLMESAKQAVAGATEAVKNVNPATRDMKEGHC